MPKYTTPPSWYDKNGSEINIFDNTTYDSIVKNTAIGTSAIAGSPYGYGAVAVGSQAHAKGNDSIAVGSQAHAEELNSIAIGSYDEMGGSSRNVEALATGSIAIGAGAKTNADSTDGIAIGRGTTSSQGGIAIGGSVEAAGIGSIAIGSGASTDTDSNNGIAIGRGAISTMGGIAIGAGADAIGNKIQLGKNDTAYTLNVGNGDGAIRVGSYNVGDKVVIDSDRNIRGYSLNIGEGKFNINNDGSVSSKNYIYTTDFVSANSYRINNKSGDYIVVIDSDKNITGTSVSVTGSVTGNNIISNIYKQNVGGLIFNHSYLNLKYFKNRASDFPSTFAPVSKKIKGSGSVRFGFYNFSEITQTGVNCLYLVKIVASGGTGEGAWENEYSSLLSTIDAKGKCIFDIYTDNKLVEDQYKWGTVGVTFWYASEFDSDSRECFLTYSGTNTEITVTCKIYLIGNNGQS